MAEHSDTQITAAAAQAQTLSRPRWRTPQITVSSIKEITEAGFLTGPDGTPSPSQGS